MKIYINDEVESLEMDVALAEVSEQRRERVLRYHFKRDQKLSLAAYLLLKEGLRQTYGITGCPEFAFLEGGKPYLPEHPDVYFSLSHSKSVALCALHHHPVGADVEIIRPVEEKIVAFTMNEEECRQVMAAPEVSKAFLALWTRKEALLKLTGEGIRQDIKQVLADADQYHFETVETDSYVYSVATYKDSKL